MIFAGDIASPNAEYSEILKNCFVKNQAVFKDKGLVLNLEGLIAEISTDAKTPVLFNHPSVLKALKQADTRLVSLANNHTLDLPEHFESTSKFLNEKEIAFCGAGTTKEQVISPVRIVNNDISFSFFAACWDVMLQHQDNPNKGVYVATIRESRLIKQIEDERIDYPDNKIVILPHWNLDLEKVPFPIHREFGRALIDAGANAVVGSHSHCVQGVEKYKSGFIAYGLGNFFIPWYTYINGTIHFPEFTKISLALEWNPNNTDLTCHWFKYDYSNGRHSLTLIDSEPFESSSKLDQYTPYNGLSNKDYITWYRKHRRKSFLIPVYKHHNNRIQNAFYDYYLKKRIRLARALAKSKIRRWNN